MDSVGRGIGPGAGQQGAPASAGYAPGLGALLGKFLTSRRRGKKLLGRTPNPPAERLAQHHLARWRDEGRQRLVLEALRLGVIDQSRPPVGPRLGWPGGHFRTWKTLAIAVENARRAGVEGR